MTRLLSLPHLTTLCQARQPPAYKMPCGMPCVRSLTSSFSAMRKALFCCPLRQLKSGKDNGCADAAGSPTRQNTHDLQFQLEKLRLEIKNMKKLHTTIEKATNGTNAQESKPYYDTAACGKRIQQLRKAAGYTQETLADILGIDRSFLSRIEAGNCLLYTSPSPRDRG